MHANPYTLFLLTDGIPPYVMGGMQKHSRLLAEYLARQGAQVVLYHCVDDPVDCDDEKVQMTFSSEAREKIVVRSFLYVDDSKLPGHYLRAQKRLSQQYFDRLVAENLRPDFIYTKGFVGSEILKRRKQLPFSPKIGVKFHGMNMFQRQPDWKGELVKYMLRPAARNIMNTADVVFSYGGKITAIIANEIRDPSTIVEIPSGIGSDWIRPEDQVIERGEKLKVLFVGRMDRLKGLPELFEAIRQLPQADNWTLTVVGPIPPKEQFAHPAINYIGAISDSETLKGIYDTHDVLVCPSISEGMPNVIMEAMARGLAIMATDVGATAVLVDSTNGWLMPSHQPRVIADAFYQVLSQPKLIEHKLASIMKMRSNFLWETIAAKHLEWFRNIDQP